MKSLKSIFTLILFMMVYPYINAQTSQDQKEVNKIIVKLFDGMREGDSAKVHSTFRDDVRMISSFTNKKGEKVIHEGQLAGFLKSIGTPHPNVWDEKIWDTEIKIDGDFAQVWTSYAFYLDDQFSHCGIDAFHLVRNQNGEWKIINLSDTRHKESCDIKD